MLKVLLNNIIVLSILLCYSCDNSSHFTSSLDNSLYINNDLINVGYINADDTLYEHVFCLLNKSNDTCIIESIVPDCECVEVSSNKTQLVPGDSCLMNFKFTIKDEYFHISKSAYIYVKNRKNPLSIAVNLIRPMSQDMLKKNFPYKLSNSIFLSSDSFLLCDSNYSIVKLLNMSDETDTLSYKLTPATKHFDVFLTEILNPGEIGQILISADTLKNGMYNLRLVSKDGNLIDMIIKECGLSTTSL